MEGKYQGTHILIDDQTGSLWTPAFGKAVHGPLKGVRLERLPVYLTPWDEWKTLRPDSWLAEGAMEPRDGHGAEWPDPNTPYLPRFVHRTRVRPDRRLPDHELVLGLELEGRWRAYPLASLRRKGAVLGDTLAGRPIVIYTRPSGWISLAFERTLDDRTLEFRPAQDGAGMVETGTGSVFDLTGTAVSGPLTGRQLRFILSSVEKWCAWSAANPGTELSPETRS